MEATRTMLTTFAGLASLRVFVEYLAAVSKGLNPVDIDGPRSRYANGVLCERRCRCAGHRIERG
jgi:hypothetical protein